MIISIEFFSKSYSVCYDVNEKYDNLLSPRSCSSFAFKIMYMSLATAAAVAIFFYLERLQLSEFSTNLQDPVLSSYFKILGALLFSLRSVLFTVSLFFDI